MSFSFPHATGIGTPVPFPNTYNPASTGMSKGTTYSAERTWDGFDIYCGTFRFRRTSILTLVMCVLALSCIGGASVISLSFFRVASAIRETERIIDPALTAALPMVRSVGGIMEDARQASSTVGALLNRSVTAADAVGPAILRATAMLNATTVLVDRMARLARHPTLRVQMESD